MDLFNVPYWLDTIKNYASGGRKIVLYGMGNGADKLLDLFSEEHIPVYGIFASDDFSRHQEYRGFVVKTFREIISETENPVIIMAFASCLPEVMSRIDELDGHYTLIYPDLPVVGNAIFSPLIAKMRREEIETAYEFLADEHSRQVFASLLRFKLSGKLSDLRGTDTPRENAIHGILKLQDDEDYLDLGAYNGDTIGEFLRETGGRYRSITALEPAPKNYEHLESFIRENGLENVRLYCQAVSDRIGESSFSAKSGRGAMIGDGKIRVPVTTVDTLLAGARVSYIKMDVEGEEKGTILGMQKTISLHRPKLSVSAYHRGEDLVDLPLLLKKSLPEYKIFLRKHTYYPGWESVFYVT